MNCIDTAIDVRLGEELDKNKLALYLKDNLCDFKGGIDIKQFPGGFSNLTYLIKFNKREYVLRRPPFGANIKSAHDMSREFDVLSLLEPVYSKIPKPIIFCGDNKVIGSPFFLMERVKGVILRNKIPQGLDLTPQHFEQLSIRSIENLVDLHNLELKKSNLISLGKPKGFVKRQVKGWGERYFRAETDDIRSMNFTTEWMESNLPKTSAYSFIHNDYKYDNLVLDANSLNIIAVVDW